MNSRKKYKHMKANLISLLRRNGFGAPATWVLAASTLIFVSAAVARPPSGGSAADLDGRWYHDGKPTRILVAPDGRSITIINELGQSSDGYANGPRNLVIPSLGITGEVNKKGRRISWTNGTEWTREAKNPGPDSGKALADAGFVMASRRVSMSQPTAEISQSPMNWDCGLRVS